MMGFALVQGGDHQVCFVVLTKLLPRFCGVPIRMNEIQDLLI